MNLKIRYLVGLLAGAVVWNFTDESKGFSKAPMMGKVGEEALCPNH